MIETLTFIATWIGFAVMGAVALAASITVLILCWVAVFHALKGSLDVVEKGFVSKRPAPRWAILYLLVGLRWLVRNDFAKDRKAVMLFLWTRRRYGYVTRPIAGQYPRYMKAKAAQRKQEETP